MVADTASILGAVASPEVCLEQLPPPHHPRTRSSPSPLTENLLSTQIKDPDTNEPIFMEIGRISPRYETPPGSPTGPPGTPPPPYTTNVNFGTVGNHKHASKCIAMLC